MGDTLGIDTTFTLQAYQSFIDTNTVPDLLSALTNCLNSHFESSTFAIGITITDTETHFLTAETDALPFTMKLNDNELFSGEIYSSTETISDEYLELITSLIERKDSSIRNIYKTSADTTERLLGITFHDVRNTLGSISGIAQLLEMDAEGNNEILESVHDIVKIIDTFDQDTITAMKLIRGQTLSYEKNTFSLSELFQLILKKNSRVYQLSSIEVTSDVADGITCIGDENRVREIFQELLTNAATAISDNGGNITVSVEQIGTNVKISVSHSGTSIKSDVQEYIFTPFFTTKEKGRGMGLTRIKHYLNDWDGKIEYSSKSNEPVCFVATFPVNLP